MAISLDLAPSDPTALDPVCGMTVSVTSPRGGSHSHDGTEYHFCSEGCRRKFAANPAKFLAGHREEMHTAEAAISAAPGTRYICPMDPEVESDRPGTCPICGMALEPATPTAESVEDPELASMRRRLLVGVLLGVPLLAISMVDMAIPGEPIMRTLGHTTFLVLQTVLATPIVVWCGWPFFERFARSVATARPNMFTLIGLGVGTAYFFSLAILLQSLLETQWIPISEPYFESAAAIVVLVLVGQVLELRARHRTGEAVRKLLRLAPKTARVVLPDGREEELPIDQIQVGDRVRVRPGERVSVDGLVREGTTTIDESMLTGEPMPAKKSAGDSVSAGTLNGVGSIVIETTQVGSGTLLARIVHLVGDAQRSRIPLQKLVDRVSAIFVPAVILVSLATFALWMVLGSPEHRLAYGVVCAVSVLVISCPCALGLATPMAVVVGTGRGATRGVLFRDAEALERLSRVDTIVFDKTGTLTEGKPTVEATTVPDDALRLAASLEQASEHVLGQAIVAYARESRRLELRPASDIEVSPGRGVAGVVEGKRVAVGNFPYLRDLGVAGEEPTGGHGTVVGVIVDGHLAGWISIGDKIRETSTAAVTELRRAGLRTILLTGDRRASAQEVAGRLGIDTVIAEKLPEHKHSVVRDLKQSGKVVAMIGDGINDAPALAAADVGIAIGTGTDVAISSAGVTLVRPDLRAVVDARKLSEATVRTIRQNLVLAFVYNLAAVPIAAGILIPFGGGLISPIWAAAAMSLSSVSVIANSLRIR